MNLHQAIRAVVEIGRKTLRLTPKISIVLISVGLLVFYSLAAFTNLQWAQSYYLWDKLKDVVLLLAVYQLSVKLRPYSLPLVIFVTIRFLWELAAMIWKVDINDRQAVNYLFLGLLGSIVWIYLKELGKCQR